MALLEVEGLEAGYGKKTVLQGVALRVHEGEVVTVLGHNGAGKSTTLKTILGLLPARSGQVRFAGKPWANGDPADNVRRGMALVPQGRGVFPDLTVIENLMLGAYTRRDAPATEADVLLLDEPTSGLDTESLARIVPMVRRLVERGKTVLLIEHNMELIAQLSDEVVFLHQGSVIARGRAAEITRDPALTEIYFGV